MDGKGNKALGGLKGNVSDFFYEMNRRLSEVVKKFMPAKKTNTISNVKRKRMIFVACMLAVPILNFLVFFVYVNYNSILLAFQQKLPDGGMKYSLFNFQAMFNEFQRADSVMIEALRNTLVFFFVGIAVLMPASLLLSYFLYKRIKFYSFYRIIFFLPSIISPVVLTALYKYMLSPDGTLSFFLEHYFNIAKENIPTFLGDSRYAIWVIVIYCIWTGFGVNMVLFNGAMSRIPEDVIEYGRLEGVSMPRELFGIVIPLIWPTLSTIIIFTVVGIFSASGPILLMTNGEFKTFTISFWIFDQVYTKGVYEYASAVGLFFTAIGLPLVLIVKWALSKIGQDIEY